MSPITARALESYRWPSSSVTVTSAPAAEPVLVSEAKEHVRVLAALTHDDAYLEALITTARVLVEEWTGRALITQTHAARYDVLPSERAPLLLPRAPVTAVSSVVSYSSADVAATLSTSAYLVDTTSVPARIALNDGQSWPSDLRAVNAVTVTYVAGYGSGGSTVPRPLRHAILMLVGHWYEQREPVVTTGSQPVELPFAIKALVAPYRVWPL